MELGSLLPERSAEDIFAGRVRLTLAGQAYILPTLPIEQEEAWLASVDGRLQGLLSGISGSGNDISGILGLLTGASDQLLDVLYAYDTGKVLPPRDEVRRTARSNEVLTAVLGVWRAANPLADIALLSLPRLLAGTNGRSPEGTSSPLPATDGTPDGSEPVSAASSSSPTSTRPANGATTNGRRRSKR